MSPRPLRSGFLKNWFAVEAIPLYVIVGAVLGGGAWYTYRLAKGPTIVWTKANPTPWNSIQQDENTKLLNVNQKFDKNWTREKL